MFSNKIYHHSWWTRIVCRGVTGIFFWGGKLIFPDFFPRREMLFPGRKFPPFFVTFPPSIYNFPPSLFRFSFFWSISPVFLASLFPICQEISRSSEVGGGEHSAPAPPPRLLRHRLFVLFTNKCSSVNTIISKSWWWWRWWWWWWWW